MAGLRLHRPARRNSAISLVSMIDVMMILLFFFMVTSTYLDLDMVPALQSGPDGAAAPQTSAPTAVLVRIAADGSAAVAGQPLSLDGLSVLIAARLATEPLTPIVILPSGGADLQALISVMDRLTAAGAVRMRVIRLEAAP